MASITGYSSPVDLGLGRVPMSTDPENFDELVDIYNAIHLLNQYLDRLRTSADGGGSGQNPAETMPFNRFFVAPALQVITAGMIISPSAITGQNGIVRGALAHVYTSTTPECNLACVALNDAAIGEDVRVGVGPAVLEIPGAVQGAYMYAYAQRAVNGALANNGTLYLNNPGPLTVGASKAYPIKVAVSILNDFALFGKFLKHAF
ncbi:hypothetical protein D3C81_934860 [compost metagenome]